MPLVENLPNDQKAQIYDFWAGAFAAIGVEPVVTRNPSSWLFLEAGTVERKQVEALRQIAAKYLTFADRLEAEIKRHEPVIPENENGDGGDEDDMPPPLVEAPRRRASAARGRDGRGGPAPDPVKPRIRGER